MKILKKFHYSEYFCIINIKMCNLPNDTFFFWVIWSFWLTFKSFAKLVRVRGGSNNSKLTRRMNSSCDAGDEILISEFGTPNLSVTHEE